MTKSEFFYQRYAGQTLPRATHGNLRFDGWVGYSYAEPVINIVPDLKLRLITDQTWSRTTDRHVRDYEWITSELRALGVLGVFDETIYVPYPAVPSSSTNYEYLLNHFDDSINNALAPRIRDKTRIAHLTEAENWLRQYDVLAERTGRTGGERYEKLKRVLGEDRNIARIRAVRELEL